MLFLITSKIFLKFPFLKELVLIPIQLRQLVTKKTNKCVLIGLWNVVVLEM